MDNHFFCAKAVGAVKPTVPMSVEPLVIAKLNVKDNVSIGLPLKARKRIEKTKTIEEIAKPKKTWATQVPTLPLLW